MDIKGLTTLKSQLIKKILVDSSYFQNSDNRTLRIISFNEDQNYFVCVDLSGIKQMISFDSVDLKVDRFYKQLNPLDYLDGQ